MRSNRIARSNKINDLAGSPELASPQKAKCVTIASLRKARRWLDFQISRNAIWVTLILAFVAFFFLTANPTASYAAESVPPPTYAGISEQEFSRLLREKMPLPVSRFSRTWRNGNYAYGVSLDANTLPYIKDGLITFTFELHPDASLQEFRAAITEAARRVRAAIAHARDKSPIPGTMLEYQ